MEHEIHVWNHQPVVHQHPKISQDDPFPSSIASRRHQVALEVLLQLWPVGICATSNCSEVTAQKTESNKNTHLENILNVIKGPNAPNVFYVVWLLLSIISCSAVLKGLPINSKLQNGTWKKTIQTPPAQRGLDALRFGTAEFGKLLRAANLEVN